MFYDIETTGRSLVHWLIAFLAMEVIRVGTYVYAIASPKIILAYPEIVETIDDIGPVLWIDAASLLVFVPVIFLTLRWIYRANANAQQLADGMIVSPGWNVGWFFVPVANTWRPFTGLREAWAVSRNPYAWLSVDTPMILRVWWTFWLLAMVLDYALLRLTWDPLSEADIVLYLPLDLAAATIWCVAAGLLIRVVLAMSRDQAETIMLRAFT